VMKTWVLFLDGCGNGLLQPAETDAVLFSFVSV